MAAPFIFILLNVLLVHIGPALYIMGAVEGGAGGFVGHEIYTKIRDRSAIQWIQKPRA